jgi:hypothetical protein
VLSTNENKRKKKDFGGNSKSIQVLNHKEKMKIENRNGVLGLDTAKAVMITFLVLSVIGLSTMLALTSLGDATSNTIDVTTGSVTNETGAWINDTTYTVDQSTLYGFTNLDVTALFNATDDTAISLANITVSGSGFTNATESTWDDVLVSYTYTYSKGQVNSIVVNVSSGLTTFFASTGTVFSILIVVVIILAISIIIWAVGRFGNAGQEAVSL